MMRRWIRKFVATLFGYTVCVPEYNGLHFALSKNEAIEWVNAYPQDCAFYVFRKGELI